MSLLQMQTNKCIKHGRVYSVSAADMGRYLQAEKEDTKQIVVVVVDYLALSICSHDTDISIYPCHDFFHNHIIRNSICKLMIR